MRFMINIRIRFVTLVSKDMSASFLTKQERTFCQYLFFLFKVVCLCSRDGMREGVFSILNFSYDEINIFQNFNPFCFQLKLALFSEKTEEN